jgi:Carbamoyltransferase N-terminus
MTSDSVNPTIASGSFAFQDSPPTKEAAAQFIAREDPMLILGVSDIEHDTAAALLNTEGAVAAIEEEKLSRSWPTEGIPKQAIDRCLREASAEISDLSLAAMASRPKRAWLRDEQGRLTAFISRAGGRSHSNAVPDALFWKLDQSRELRRQLGPGRELVNFRAPSLSRGQRLLPQRV